MVRLVIAVIAIDVFWLSRALRSSLLEWSCVGTGGAGAGAMIRPLALGSAGRAVILVFCALLVGPLCGLRISLGAAVDNSGVGAL